jgi:hypothetical protein
VFNALEYSKEVEDRLSRIAPNYRLAFAVWCLRGIYSRYHDYIASELKEFDVEFFAAPIDVFWEAGTSGATPSAQQLQGFKQWCNTAIPWDMYDTLAEALATHLVGSVDEIITFCEDASPRHAMVLSDSAITCIYFYEVTDREGREPEIKEELDAQRRMLEYLETSPDLEARDIHVFRTVS